jgi:hypothetical protein
VNGLRSASRHPGAASGRGILERLRAALEAGDLDLAKRLTDDLSRR